MNSLSWFLYLADIVGNIGVVCGIVIFVAGLASIGFLFMTAVNGGAFASSKEKEYSAIGYKYFKRCLLVLLISASIGSLLPNKNTMYAIAASEMGEEAVKSKIGQKSLQALEQWLDSQISKDKK